MTCLKQVGHSWSRSTQCLQLVLLRRSLEFTIMLPHCSNAPLSSGELTEDSDVVLGSHDRASCLFHTQNSRTDLVVQYTKTLLKDVETDNQWASTPAEYRNTLHMCRVKHSAIITFEVHPADFVVMLKVFLRLQRMVSHFLYSALTWKRIVDALSNMWAKEFPYQIQ